MYVCKKYMYRLLRDTYNVHERSGKLAVRLQESREVAARFQRSGQFLVGSLVLGLSASTVYTVMTGRVYANKFQFTRTRAPPPPRARSLARATCSNCSCCCCTVQSAVKDCNRISARFSNAVKNVEENTSALEHGTRSSSPALVRQCRDCRQRKSTYSLIPERIN